MTKRLIVMALVLAALASTVSAQDSFSYALQDSLDTVNAPVRVMAQNLCDNHRGTGDAMEASWCDGVVLDHMGRVSGYNPNSVRGQRARGFRVGDMYRARRHQQYGYGYGGYYGGYGYDPYGYGRTSATEIGVLGGAVLGGIATRNSNSTLARVGGVVGGALLGGVIGHKLDERNERREYGYDDRERGEDPSECIKRTTKEFKKARVAFTADQVIAVCSGNVAGSGPAPEPPDAQPESAPAPAPRTQVERSAGQANMVYVQGDKLCNDTANTVIVYVDGKPVGRLAAGQVVSLSSLPQGKVQYFPVQ